MAGNGKRSFEARLAGTSGWGKREGASGGPDQLRRRPTREVWAAGRDDSPRRSSAEWGTFVPPRIRALKVDHRLPANLTAARAGVSEF